MQFPDVPLLKEMLLFPQCIKIDACALCQQTEVQLLGWDRFFCQHQLLLHRFRQTDIDLLLFVPCTRPDTVCIIGRINPVIGRQNFGKQLAGLYLLL